LTACLKLVTPLLLLLAPLPSAQNTKRLDKLEKDVQKLDRKYEDQKTKDPMHQAKALAKLLPKGVELAGLEIQAGRVSRGIGMITRYRDEANRVYRALISTGRNPAKKPDGFMQLQIALRESVLGLRGVFDVAPFAEQTTVEAVRGNMEQLNAQLLQELFPPPKPRPRKKRRHP
jgi:hypothetical protein